MTTTIPYMQHKISTKYSKINVSDTNTKWKGWLHLVNL